MRNRAYTYFLLTAGEIAMKYLVPVGAKKVKERAHRWNEGEDVTYCHMPQTEMSKTNWILSESPGEHLIVEVL